MELNTGIQNFGRISDGTQLRTEFSQTVADMRNMTHSLGNGIAIKANEISMWE